MTMRQTVKTNCRFCGYQCGLTATVENGRVVEVAPDPTQYPGDERIQHGCHRWRMAPAFLDHPDRINYPRKRVGERGSGEWQRISWDQALDEIAEKLVRLKDCFGPETLATCIGGPHTVFWPLHRFMTLFGSPNNVGIGQICWNPGTLLHTISYGWTLDNELDPELTNAALLWGVNQAESDNSLLWHRIQSFSRTGKPLIVVDPRRTRTAEQATHWLPIRPGTDAVLALGFVHLIIQEQLYDAAFVSSWCHGFDKLIRHVEPYTPDYVASVTGIPASQVIEVARLYARNSPSALFSGRGIDQIGSNTVPTHQTFAILRAITGNVDRKGASCITEMPDFIPELDLELSDRFPEARRSKQLGNLKLHSYTSYEQIRTLTSKQGKRLPMRYLTSAQPDLVWQAMLTDQPYPIRSMIVMATNPLLTQADTRTVYEALKRLDLLVVLELFNTSTAMLADYLLPSAGALERALFETKAGTANLAYGGAKAVEPYYERRPDFDFWQGLGRRLGQEEDWPWKTFEDSLEATLAPTGVDWETFSRHGLYSLPEEYGKHEKTDPETGTAVGFATTTGKIELYNELLASLGADPLPVPKPLLATDEEYPFSLITGARYHPYYASSFHQIEELKRLHPEPWAEVSHATAKNLRLVAGTTVKITTLKGEACFILKIVEMCDDVVSVEYGWWYPERKAAEPDLGGLRLSNANLLTSADYATADPLIGTATYNGIPCRLQVVDRDKN